MQDPADAEPHGVGGGVVHKILAIETQFWVQLVLQQYGSFAQTNAQHTESTHPGVECTTVHKPVAPTGQVCADANPLAKAHTAISPQRKFEIEVTVCNIGNIRQKYEIQSRII